MNTSREDLSTFIIISHWTLLRIRNVSDKICRENQNTNFMFSNFFTTVMSLENNLEKNMVEADRTQIWQ